MKWFYGEFRWKTAQPPWLSVVHFVNQHHIKPQEIIILEGGAVRMPDEKQNVGFMRFMYYATEELEGSRN